MSDNDGIATTMVDSMLTTLTTSPACSYVQLHTGDPGSAGTALPSGNTVRQPVTWASPSGGSVSANGTAPEWTNWPEAQNGEIETDISFWTEETYGDGVFNMSIELSSSVTMDTGDSLTLTSIEVTIPTAA